MQRWAALQQALRDLQARARLATSNSTEMGAYRVAIRWLKVASRTENDVVARLQVLEGAAGVRFGTWANLGFRGLEEAQAHMGNTVKPMWFSRRDMGLYGILVSAAQKVISSYSTWTQQTPEDIMQNVLGGFNLDGSVTNKKLLPSVGKQLSRKILTGVETPASVGGGLASTLVERKTLNEVKRHRKQDNPDDSGAVTVQDMGRRPQEFPDFILGLLQERQGIGNKTYSFILQYWRSRAGKALPYLEAWLENIRKGLPLSNLELANQFAITFQTFGRNLRNWLPQTMQALEKSRLWPEIERAYRLHQGGIRAGSRRQSRSRTS